MPLPSKVKDIIPALNLIPHPEGGFFVETWRSGSEPMSTQGQTGLDAQDSEVNLVVAAGRAENRPDNDERRNALTSIFWCPTIKSPKLHMTRNCSDHVHYYQGGKPFRYYLLDPSSGEFTTYVLGPELHKGQKLQVPVKGGSWKCGKIDDSDEESSVDYDYSLIGEAVAPGFDFHDFTWVTKTMLDNVVKDEETKGLLSEYIFAEATEDGKTVEAASQFYEEGETKDQRVAERS
mmetsp:Transcript_2509/g.5834  ORF Transcript_2509/g.5834 Transcript_2509/m.5834 type:complete len:234 (+) Transcript_2509:264-965(+)